MVARQGEDEPLAVGRQVVRPVVELRGVQRLEVGLLAVALQEAGEPPEAHLFG